ncbi:MAG TPA: TIGR02217 family protein, partial [Sphingopyxis terrae]|nr:TIGR02217 family protein [Sphingopyxis terrae]
MSWALVAAEPHHRKGWVKRFDPRFWTIDFARPMMASAVTTAPDALRIDAVFHNRHDLAGLIWEAADRWDHPLLGYETRRDFRHSRLRFRWRSGGVKPLDALHGPTLTIEGRDAAGAPRAWYVRLWNYADGSGEDAFVTLDFDALAGGFSLPDEADPVWAGDIDRMFVSLVPPAYDGSEGVLAEPVEGWAELSSIACDGSGSVLAIGDTILPELRRGIATGYDDLYHLTPARVVRQIVQLGYRGEVVHYVGMSHFMRLAAAGEMAGALSHELH